MFSFVNPASHMEFLSVVLKSVMDPGCILLNIHPVAIGMSSQCEHIIENVCVLKS